MVTIDTDTLRLRRLPVEWQELAEVVMVGHARQAGEDVFEVRERVFAVALAGDDQRVQDRGALAGFRVADKQLDLFPDTRGSDRIFHEVVIEAAFAVLQMGAKRRPLAEE